MNSFNFENDSPESKKIKLEADIDNYDPSAISSKGLVYIGDKLLIYRRGPEAPTHPLFLDVPGGRTQGEETPFETWKREVKEEFNLDVDRDAIVWSRKYDLEDRPDQSVYFNVSVFPESSLKDVQLGDEGIEWILMTAEEFLAKQDVHQPFLDRTRAYVESLQ